MRELLSFYHTIAPDQTDAVSFIYPISAVQSMLNGMTRIKAGIKPTSGTDLIRETRKPAAIVNELINLVKRAGTVRPSLFLPKFPSLFLASCRNQRVLKSSRLRSEAEQ